MFWALYRNFGSDSYTMPEINNTSRVPKTIEEKLLHLAETTSRIRKEKFAQGFPFLISLEETPELSYYEYGDGRIEVRALVDKDKKILRTLTGTDADAIREKAEIEL